MTELHASDSGFEPGMPTLLSVFFVDNLKLDLATLRDGLTYVILAIWPMAEI